MMTLKPFYSTFNGLDDDTIEKKNYILFNFRLINY